MKLIGIWIFALILVITTNLGAQNRPQIDPIEFEPEFIDRLGETVSKPFFDLLPVVQPARVESVGFAERNFSVFIEVFTQFLTFVNQFREAVDEQYSTIGDFKAYYQRYFKQDPRFSLQFEGSRLTVQGQTLIQETEGGGAGIRVDVRPHRDGKLSVLFFPLYSELRSVQLRQTHLGIGQDVILRANVGANYNYTATENIEPGVQASIQPQLSQSGRYRFYGEAFIRFKLMQSKSESGRYLKLQEISLVPKVIFSHNNESASFITDGTSATQTANDISQALFKSSYRELSTQVYGLINLEFRYRM